VRILLVEDEPSAARMLAKGLREQTYAVDVAADGEAALERAYVNFHELPARVGAVAPRPGAPSADHQHRGPDD
jgi:hypothetical protein